MKSDITHYGFTCEKCPSRGAREVVGDFVPLPTTREIEGSQAYFNESNEISNVYEMSDNVRYFPIGYPDRCKVCNARYQRHKTAREAVSRLEIMLKNSRNKYLKFVTLTHATESAKWHLYEIDNSDAVRRFYKWYLEVRAIMFAEYKATSGTDVLECVEHEYEEPLFGFRFKRYHVHSHGIWNVAYIDFKKWNKLKNKLDIGRDKIEPIKDTYNQDGCVDKRAMWRATDYLSKYISKENVGIKRMVWGKVRRWKDFIDLEPKELICKKCISSTWILKQVMDGKREACTCVTNV